MLLRNTLASGVLTREPGLRSARLLGFAVLLVWSLWRSPSQQGTTYQVNKQAPPGPKFHHWTKTKSWLCPGRVPNLTAAITTFQLAQQIGLKRRGKENTEVPALSAEDIKNYFSFWPGHVYFRDEKTNKTAAFLRTYKCGSETIEGYFVQLSSLGEREQLIDLPDFLKSPARESDCIGAAFRDPMDHFFSGLGELEMRRTRLIDKGFDEERMLPDYERMDILSEDRLVAFIEFLLRGDWFDLRDDKDKRVPYHWLDFGHVFPQSGYLVGLLNANLSVSTFIDLKNLTSALPKVLEEECGLPKGLPELETIHLHDKVPGLSGVYKKFWAKGSTKELTGTPKLPIIQALCLFHVMDYACLAPELKAPPPEVCAEVFYEYLSEGS
jgi:hypothetical protein